MDHIYRPIVPLSTRGKYVLMASLCVLGVVGMMCIVYYEALMVRVIIMTNPPFMVMVAEFLLMAGIYIVMLGFPFVVCLVHYFRSSKPCPRDKRKKKDQNAKNGSDEHVLANGDAAGSCDRDLA